MRTSLVIPAYNEEEALPPVLDEVRGMADEVIVVDDGSTDRTAAVAERAGVVLVRHPDNRGKMAASRSGIARATGEVIIIMDADHTYPARHIPELVARVERGADLVLGSRLSGTPCAMPPLNRIGNRFFSLIISLAGARRVLDGQTGFRAFRRDRFGELDVEAGGLEWEMKMTAQAQRRGRAIVEVPVEYRERIGRSKLRPVPDGARMLAALAAVIWRESPPLSRAVLLSGALAGAAGIALGIASLGGPIPGHPPPLSSHLPTAALLALLSLALISLGLRLGAPEASGDGRRRRAGP